MSGIRDTLPENTRAVGVKEFVPPSIRERSRVVTWLWRHTAATSRLTYDRARWLSRWLP